jgi:hypothetical protein
MRWPVGRPAVAAYLRSPSFLERVRKKIRFHAAPASACDCGIYGAGFTTATSYLMTPANAGAATVGRVAGIVALWGDVVEREAGWRASRGYPRHLFVPGLNAGTKLLSEGLRAYGVSVDVVDASRALDVSAALAPFDPLSRGTPRDAKMVVRDTGLESKRVSTAAS